MLFLCELSDNYKIDWCFTLPYNKANQNTAAAGGSYESVSIVCFLCHACQSAINSLISRFLPDVTQLSFSPVKSLKPRVRRVLTR